MSHPDELLTVAYCPGCELVSLAGDCKTGDHPQDGTGDQLFCPRCGTRLSADHFHDYVDKGVVDHA